jgi:hypothetical protein
LSFDAFQQRLVASPARARGKAAELPASFAAFDLLAAGGMNLRTHGGRRVGTGSSSCRVTGCLIRTAQFAVPSPDQSLISL